MKHEQALAIVQAVIGEAGGPVAVFVGTRTASWSRPRPWTGQRPTPA